MEDQVNLFVPPDRVQRTSSRRWPTLFWVTLKVLSVFHHRNLVTERKCYSCKLKDLSERKSMNEDAAQDELDLNCLLLMYESDWKRTKEDRNGNNDRQLCEVCDTMWWNFQGKTERYNAREIGASFWNHRGSGVLASCVLLLTIAALVYETGFYVSVMWAKPEQTLSLLNRLTIFVLLISHPVMCLSSKLRSMLRSAVPYLSWTTTLNARYIIRRAQILDLPRKGLPGKVFFFACMTWPLFNSMYRSYIYLYLSECDLGLHAVATAVVAILFMQTWGFFVYLLYFIRMSFQRNINLLLSFIKEHEGQLDKCRGVLAGLAVDFSCYSRLCSLYCLVMIPVGLLALTTNITWEYILGATCAYKDPHRSSIEHQVKLMSWSEMTMAFFLLLTAMNGIQVTYMWDELPIKFMHLRSDCHDHFWRALSLDVSSVRSGSTTLLTTVVGSLIGIYMGLHFGSEQNVTLISKSCVNPNSTFPCT